MRNRLIVPGILLLCGAMLAAACGTGTEQSAPATAPPRPVSVLDRAIEADQFSTLLAAVEAAGLSSTLDGQGPFTVFAPTNAAFDQAIAALGITNEQFLSDPNLANLLTYHVLPQQADLQLVASLDGELVPTLNGQSVQISVVDGVVTVNDGEIVSGNLVADNGLVHVINAVLIPPDLVGVYGTGTSQTTVVAAAPTSEQAQTTAPPTSETVPSSTEQPPETSAPETTAPPETTAAPETTAESTAPPVPETIMEVLIASGNFPTLVAALQATGLDQVLSGGGPLTLFAPTEGAFAFTFDQLGVTADQLVADGSMASILSYHIVPAEGTTAVLLTLDGQGIPTLLGPSLAVTTDGGAPLVNGVPISVPDVIASNGVIHVIDAILFPPEG